MGPRKPHLPAPSPASKSRHVEENRPRNGSASPPALSWYASLSAMSLSPTEAIGSDYLSSSSSFTKQVSNTLSTKPVQGTHPPNQPFQPIVPSQPIPRTLPGQSIPISLLLNPTPQSPRPFAFLELSSRSPSPSPSALSSSAASRLVRSEQRFRCISHAALVADSSTGTLPATEHTPKGGSKRSRLSASEHQSQGVSDSNIPFRLSPDCRSNGTVIYSPTMGKKITSNGKDDASRSLDLLGHGRREFNANETHTGDTTREVSVRKKTKPDVKTTKTGKILHRSRRIGVNKRNTAYNRFLQQRSRYLAKYESHLTPQQVSQYLGFIHTNPSVLELSFDGEASHNPHGGYFLGCWSHVLLLHVTFDSLSLRCKLRVS
ncbi:hypothetical protein B0O80DRAFT_159916 [Mortierella sp. GBAus27b]|nr:hypothetical protein B0O80DRAFT_159916 [Mortierella sp. GBAus27b]